MFHLLLATLQLGLKHERCSEPIKRFAQYPDQITLDLGMGRFQNTCPIVRVWGFDRVLVQRAKVLEGLAAGDRVEQGVVDVEGAILHVWFFEREVEDLLAQLERKGGEGCGHL